MAVISMIVVIIVLGLLYRWMIKREIPEPIGKKQALVPVGLGIISLPLSFVLLLGLATCIRTLGYSPSDHSLPVQSVVRAFFMAGLPEELAKFLMILLTLIIFRSAVKNVYEYVLIGSAVGFGFSIFEDFLYGTSMFNLITRLILVALHMILSGTMALHLGKARYNKRTGEGAVVINYILAFLIPIMMHTIYDACTVTNKYLQQDSENLQTVGMIIGVAMLLVMFIVQILYFIRIKKKAEELSAFVMQ